MIIQMVYQMSGGRYDDRQWPAPWHDFEVTDEEGRGLIRCGAAMEVVGGTAPSTPEGSLVSQQAPEPEPVQPAWQGLPSSSNDPIPVPPPAPVEDPIVLEPEENPPVPLNADPKAAWVEYAVSRGMNQADAESMTKAQLQAEYGGRL